MEHKIFFEKKFTEFIKGLKSCISTADGQWSIKGFIDVFKNVYTISADTKIVSKILEIHLFPHLVKFAYEIGYKIVLADHQNYYPDLTFVNSSDESVMFAVDLKTTYRLEKQEYCNGFTLGSHGKYFKERDSKKNIQFPYNRYLGHFCLGIIYNRTDGSSVDGISVNDISKLHEITSVVKDFQFFIVEKWKIASDKSGSGNTANIGSIKHIEDILAGRGVFHKLGEDFFDDYWMNYGEITIKDSTGKTKKIANIEDFVRYRKGDLDLIYKRNKRGGIDD